MLLVKYLPNTETGIVSIEPLNLVISRHFCPLLSKQQLGDFATKGEPQLTREGMRYNLRALIPYFVPYNSSTTFYTT